MVSRVWKWFTERWPWYPLKRLLLDEEIPGGSSFAYTFGSAILVILSLQVISGIFQLFYYVPTVDHAYDSVSYLRTQIPFGWLVHNIHYWGASMMIILVALHMVRVYIWGAYKTQLTWLIGIALVVTTMTLIQTGTPLPWDQKGYWAGEVGTSIPGTIPVVGDFMKRIIRGGEAMGQLALSRFFTIHVTILPPLLVLLIGAHIAAFRTSGVAGSWDEEKRNKKGRFWPDQTFKDMVTAASVVFILIALCVFFPPDFTGPADPSNTTYLPKPEWAFLFLYEALKYFKGPWEPVGAAGVPAVLIGLLVLVPFADRSPEKNPMLRPFAMICLAVYAGLILVLTLMGYFSPGFAQMPGSPGKPSQTAFSVSGGGASSRDSAVSEGSQVLSGADLFRSEGCIQCHSIGGEGGNIGPDLSGESVKAKGREWLREQISNPQSHNPDTIMPAHDSLSGEKLNALVDYLLSLNSASGSMKQAAGPGRDHESGKSDSSHGKKQEPSHADSQPGRAAYIIGSRDNGRILFHMQCTGCHGTAGKKGIMNPGSDDGTVPLLNPIDRELFSADPQVFAENIDRFIQHGSVPDGPNPVIHMPDFGDSHSFTQQEIANIEAYVLQLNGVNRGELVNPGMKPGNFFVLAAGIYAIVVLMLGGIWNRKFRRCDDGENVQRGGP